MNEALISHHGPGHLWLASLGMRGMELGLGRIEALLGRLGRPDRAFVSVIVAGSDGKGSTSAMLTALTAASGLRVGHYTSPHLLETRERVRIDGACVSAEALDEALCAVQTAAAAAQPLDPTPFEALTAAALWLFRSATVDIAVLEVGLGGRLDAVNAVDPVASVITHLSHDHTAILGTTLAQIAYEKCGVAREGRPLLVAQASLCKSALRKHGVQPLLRSVGHDLSVRHWALRGARLRATATLEGPALAEALEVDLDLAGVHQAENAALAVLAYQAVAQAWRERRGAALPAIEDVIASLADLDWPCRAEVIRDKPLVVLDAAHNPAGIEALASLLAQRGKSWQVMLAVRRDRDAADVVRALAPIAAGFWLPRMRGSTLMDATDLSEVIDAVVPAADVAVASAQRCFEGALREVGRGSGVVVTGSQHALGEWLGDGVVHSPRLARRLGKA